MHTYILRFFLLFAASATNLSAQIPIYQNPDMPIEVRVEDALSRMTLEEKVALCHAQSKFSSAGVPRLGIPELWMSDQRLYYGFSCSYGSCRHLESGYGCTLWQGYWRGGTLS